MQVKFELEKLFNKVTILAMICMIILTVFHGLISFGKWEETYVHKYKTVKGKLAYWSYLNVSKEYEGELNQEYLNRFAKDFQNSKERKAIESGKIYQWTKYSLARDFILPVVINESISQNKDKINIGFAGTPIVPMQKLFTLLRDLRRRVLVNAGGRPRIIIAMAGLEQHETLNLILQVLTKIASLAEEEGIKYNKTS